MSIPGKVLIALLAALAVSAAAAVAFQHLSLTHLLGPTAAAALLAVLLSHKALPMPGGFESKQTRTSKPAAADRGKREKRAKPGKATDAARESGTVKWFNSSKGFGFIIRSNGDEIFVHHRSIRGDRRSLRDGEAVNFAVVQTQKGPQAEDVEAIR